MSTALAIAGVTAVLRDLLNDGLINHDVNGVLGTQWSFDRNGDTSLTTMSGRQVKGGKFDDANAITLQAPQ